MVFYFHAGIARKAGRACAGACGRPLLPPWRPTCGKGGRKTRCPGRAARFANGRILTTQYADMTVTTMQIRLAGKDDIDRWMRLVERVRTQFPGLETCEAIEAHRRTVLGSMTRQAALCAEEGGDLAGALLFDKAESTLCFLAVNPACRRQRIATALVRRALTLLDADRDVLVTTYCDGVPEGAAARAFYKQLGFVEGRLTEAFGSPVQEFVLPAQRRTGGPAARTA